MYFKMKDAPVSLKAPYYRLPKIYKEDPAPVPKVTEEVGHPVGVDTSFFSDLKSLVWLVEEHVPTLERMIKRLEEDNRALYRQLNTMTGVFRKAKEIHNGKREENNCDDE